MLKKKRKNSELFSDNFFNSLFLVNKNEKKKVLRIVQKKDISFFLFYTDYRNLPSILANGVCQLKNVELKKDEAYYVWSYLQHEESIDLEFDISSRAYFWKWATDAGINLENLCIIALDPIKLAQQTVNDWVFDTSLKLVGVHETIPAESIKWIMIRKERPLKKVEQMAKMVDPGIEVYYGNNSEIKRLSKKKVTDPLLMISDEKPQQGEKKDE